MIDFHSSLRHSKWASPPFADYTFDLLWIALFVICESLCCWLHFVVLMQLINAKGANCKTAPWQKHKSKKQLDMTETSPWLWWVTTKGKQQWAAAAPQEIEQVNVWGTTWGGIILIRHSDSSRGLDLSPFFHSHNSFCLHSHCVVSVGYWLVFVL